MSEDHKAYVLKKFPGAQAYIDENHDDVWCIYDDTVDHGLNTVLGWGNTPEDAWADAARLLSSRK